MCIGKGFVGSPPQRANLVKTYSKNQGKTYNIFENLHEFERISYIKMWILIKIKVSLMV